MRHRQRANPPLRNRALREIASSGVIVADYVLCRLHFLRIEERNPAA